MFNFDMPYFSYSRATLVCCWYKMFEHFQLLDELQIDKGTFKSFLTKVAHSYRRQPFHNMTHAFNVTHITFYILNKLRK